MSLRMTNASQVPFQFKRLVECRREYLSMSVRRSLYVEGLRAFFFDHYFVNVVLILFKKQARVSGLSS